ncbi:uncharacterized protein BKA55DRAFT_325306 [Fusarium redolens]|uniref:Uncharacterized protein n=1 Tax=Fusarium redolens TaxID=48865 RepID=A0A9P9KC22_FUSRE|nr:uncharacterized protein BKA55DRAFT_325306 [Fusarium redolens]KAH7255673.1 hypothetical protein BKA55DRAFT_325306 [Fusarium redolens]
MFLVLARSSSCWFFQLSYCHNPATPHNSTEQSSNSLHFYSTSNGPRPNLVKLPRSGRVVRPPRHNRAVTRAPGCLPMNNYFIVLLTPNNSRNRGHITDEGGTQSCTWQKGKSFIQPKTARIDK